MKVISYLTLNLFSLVLSLHSLMNCPSLSFLQAPSKGVKLLYFIPFYFGMNKNQEP